MNELVKKYNLDLWATANTDKGTSYQYLDNLGINIILNDWDKSFEFKWLFPNSIFTLNCPTCSPYDYPGHFDRLYMKFISVVQEEKYFNR